jgi:hypothetical protein
MLLLSAVSGTQVNKSVAFAAVVSATARASPTPNLKILFMFILLLLTRAEGDFWLDVQAGILAFTRLPYVVFVAVVNLFSVGFLRGPRLNPGYTPDSCDKN